jgi:hypothetical protein
MARNEKNMRTACENMEQDLVLYYYQELESAQRTGVEIHINDCPACRHYLEEMTSIMRLTVKVDEPPETFWSDYSREMRQKLADARDKQPWWRSWTSLLQPWPRPALAMAAVVALALTITFGKGFWRTQESPPDDQALIEVLPVAENLEFFKNMEVLDAMDAIDFLENPDGANKGTT